MLRRVVDGIGDGLGRVRRGEAGRSARAHRAGGRSARSARGRPRGARSVRRPFGAGVTRPLEDPLRSCRQRGPREHGGDPGLRASGPRHARAPNVGRRRHRARRRHRELRARGHRELGADRGRDHGPRSERGGDSPQRSARQRQRWRGRRLLLDRRSARSSSADRRVMIPSSIRSGFTTTGTPTTAKCRRRR